MKTIGFFGDSFCAVESANHSIEHNYKTYIQLLKDYYKVEIVNLGWGGTSVWDLLLVQLNPLIRENKVPDVCVFIWTCPGRLFHRVARGIHHSSGLAGFNAEKFKQYAYAYPDRPNIYNEDVYNAAKSFYLHLYDQEKEDIEYLSAIEYIDTKILTNLPTKTKIIHLWSFGSQKSYDVSYDDRYKIENIDYPYKWQTGVEVRPPLICTSAKEEWISHLQRSDERPNHFGTELSNNTIFQQIKNAIDNYHPGTITDYTNEY